MRIASFDTSSKVMVIAEIGNNHEGDFDLAKEMLIKAADSGADAVKFQTIRAEKLCGQADPARLARLKGFELSDDEFTELAEMAAGKSVIFLSTPFDLEAAEFLDSLVPAFKISSGDNSFFPLLDRVASFGKPVILSTGLCDMSTLRICLDRLKARCVEIALLHCSCSYPVPDREVNLNAIQAIKKEFGCEVGYSDHSVGIEAPVLSVALGARIVEKHFTIDNNLSDFRDHKLSAGPDDFSTMVQRIRTAEIMIGDGIKKVSDSEKANLIAARRSIAAACDIEAGTELTMDCITWLRPGDGLPPGSEDKLMGRRLRRAVKAGEKLTTGLLE